MGRKGGVNEKVSNAKAHQDELSRQRKAKEAEVTERKEAASWREGSNVRGSSRAMEAVMKEELAAKRATEKKALREAEDAELAQLDQKGIRKDGKGNRKGSSNGLAPWELSLDSGEKKTKWERKQEADAKRKACEEKRRVSQEVVVENVGIPENLNRSVDEQWATGMEHALADLSMDTKNVGVKNPEKRAKAAYAEFQEREIPRLREERPGLRLSQYKEICFKNWQKSPENPFNQVRKG
eukprot:353537_1